MAVSKRVRFEVLRRDNHTCRYCGGTAPDATLTVDHVVPVSLGGSDDPTNLVAACHDCNSGKASSGPNEPIVADVAQDALRWRKAMEVANEMVQQERDAQAENINGFRRHWDGWTYCGRDGEKTLPLPGNWGEKVREVYASGLTQADVAEAIDTAMSSRYVKDEFAYFLGICRQKTNQRQAMAQELIRRGMVD